MRNVDALGVLLVNMDRINHLTCACVCSCCLAVRVNPLICTALVTNL